MAVVSVEVPDNIAKKFKPYVVISSIDLYDEIDNDLKKVVNFWKKWIWKDKFKKYLLIKDSL